MDSLTNSRPLLEPTHPSDSEDFVEEDSIQKDEYPPDDFNDEDDDQEQLFKTPLIAPHDKFSFTYIVFYLLGTTTMLPWNFFITAEDYWMYKFRNVSANATDEITPIQASFTSDLSAAASLPSTVFLILNAFLSHKIPLAIRMNGALLLTLAFFMPNTALIKVDTDQWQDTFFYITIGSVVVMNMATAILSGGLFGISGQFPSEYVTAVVSGQALGGVFCAVMEIVTLTFATNAVTSAFTFFIIGNVLLVISLVCYVVMSKTLFFKYYTVERLALQKSRADLESLSGRQASEPNFRNVLNRIWLYGFTEWLVFAVTLSVYPSVTVLVNSQSHGNGHPWNDIYFIPVTNYLIFNSGDYLGRILAGMIEWPNNKPRVVAFLAILRMAFLPALLACNTNPRHSWPVYIHSDYIFIILMGFFAFSNGYLANIALIWAPKTVQSHEKEMASSTMAAFLGIGIAFGSSLSLLLVQML